MNVNSSEETLKIDVRDAYFSGFQCETLGKVDFAIYGEWQGEKRYYLWAEAKRGTASDIYESFVQLILTVGRDKTFTKVMPPKYVGAFDTEKIAFIEYGDILHIFSQNDFDWNVAPSDHTSKEFKQLLGMARETLEEKKCLYYYEEQDEELREFISENFAAEKEGTSRMEVDKNNFVHVFNLWLREVKPTIQANWESAKRKGIVEADFFLADLMSEQNVTIYDSLFVVLNGARYELDRVIDEDGFLSTKSADYNDGQRAHRAFWNRYRRPPEKKYRDYILERRDILVPDDMREKKGAFYTPEIWVAKSQEYLAEELGEDWQKDYYIWDCCAGTGNLLVGLTNKYNVFASTLDKADVEVMRQNLVGRGALIDGHVFQFDFLNDDFNSKKVPEDLRDILNDPEKRKRLVIYFNPPYVEAGNKKQVAGTGKNREGVSIQNKTYERYKGKIETAANELFAQFLIRMNQEIKGCTIAQFSKLKHLQGANFKKFREHFSAKLKRGFIIPANTFDNVTGKFPIGFFIWDGKVETTFTRIKVKAFGYKGEFVQKKEIKVLKHKRSIHQWINSFPKSKNKGVGYLNSGNVDFQNQNYVYIINNEPRNHHVKVYVNALNLTAVAVFYAVRQVIHATWINDRDQFLWPKKGWEKDGEFQSNCLAYTLFSNNISSNFGTNHWIPFTEEEVASNGLFKSHFMCDFIAGRVAKDEKGLFDGGSGDAMSAARVQGEAIVFSEKAKRVMDAGRELWWYYHNRGGQTLTLRTMT